MATQEAHGDYENGAADAAKAEPIEARLWLRLECSATVVLVPIDRVAGAIFAGV
jgi:hypothetical protein